MQPRYVRGSRSCPSYVLSRDTHADVCVEKFLFWCYDYVRVEDVRTVTFDAMKYPDTRPIIATMSEENEVVSTTRNSYVLSGSIHGITSIVVLDAGEVGARPIAPGQLYRRSDSLLVSSLHNEGSDALTQLWRSRKVCIWMFHDTEICD